MNCAITFLWKKNKELKIHLNIISMTLKKLRIIPVVVVNKKHADEVNYFGKLKKKIFCIM
jgi:hypothetical protein